VACGNRDGNCDGTCGNCGDGTCGKVTIVTIAVPIYIFDYIVQVQSTHAQLRLRVLLVVQYSTVQYSQSGRADAARDNGRTMMANVALWIPFRECPYDTNDATWYILTGVISSCISSTVLTLFFLVACDFATSRARVRGRGPIGSARMHSFPIEFQPFPIELQPFPGKLQPFSRELQPFPRELQPFRRDCMCVCVCVTSPR